MTENEENSYIIEYYSAGKSVKVTAFDPATLHEVSIVGSPRASRRQLAEVAIRKLRYMQNRDKEQ